MGRRYIVTTHRSEDDIAVHTLPLQPSKAHQSPAAPPQRDAAREDKGATPAPLATPAGTFARNAAAAPTKR